jgi:hypothetical protein
MRYEWAPPEARMSAGGNSAPWAAAYIRRLAATPVTSGEYAAALSGLEATCQAPGPRSAQPVVAGRPAAVQLMQPRQLPQSRAGPRPAM